MQRNSDDCDNGLPQEPRPWFMPEDTVRKTPEEVERLFTKTVVETKLIEGYVKKWVRCPDEILDVAQDIILKLLSAKDNSFYTHFDSTASSIKYFVYITTKNYMTSYVAKKKGRANKARMISLDAVPFDVFESPVDDHARTESNIDIERAVNKAKKAVVDMNTWSRAGDKYIDVFDMMLQGFKNKIMADKFKVSVTYIQTIKSRIKTVVKPILSELSE